MTVESNYVILISTQSETFIHENTTSTVLLLQILKQNYNYLVAKRPFAMVQPWKKPFRKAKALEFEKKRHCVTH